MCVPGTIYVCTYVTKKARQIERGVVRIPHRAVFSLKKEKAVLGVYLSSITDAQLMAGYQGMCMYTIWMKDAQTTS